MRKSADRGAETDNMFTASGQDVTEESREFLQRRVAAFGFGGGVMFMAFWTFRVVMTLLAATYEFLLDPSMLTHFMAGLSLLAVWVLCRSGSRSPRFIRAVEFFGLMGAVAGTVAMGASLPLWVRPEMIVVMALTLGFAVRSVYVPSSARRTLFLCTVAGVPIVLATYLQNLSFDPAAWSALAEDLGRLTPEQAARYRAIDITAWWICSIVLCTSASRVIYGLRREAREARQLGQYTLERKLGEGGMGEVYAARHAMLRRPTAIKLLRPEKAGETALSRFEREVQLTARLTHPNTVTIYDYGRTPDGLFYYVMELLDGATLEQVVKADGPQPASRVAWMMQQVAGALIEAHAMGSIHRDIKPANIILCQQGGREDVAKVVDFGLVKVLQAEEDVGLTSPDVVTGTPLYMPPEAVRNPSSTDARSDLYALGAVGYFLLTGTHVFSGNTVVEVCGHHMHTQPEPPSQRLGAEVPEALEELLLACLQKQPDARPQTAVELRQMLLALNLDEEWGEGQARAWWDKWGEQLRDQRRAEGASLSETMLEIELKNRSNRCCS